LYRCPVPIGGAAPAGANGMHTIPSTANSQRSALYMHLTPAHVRQIASLARLDLEEAEIESMARDLGSILDHMRELGEVEVGRVAPMGGVSEHPAPFREDVGGADPLHLPLEEVAPAWEERLFVVPRLAALDGDAIVEDRA
jgi:aspartyl-tRNA(Asn)/glutamyl-tRNA(Gln) amidotransferase subunit C